MGCRAQWSKRGRAQLSLLGSRRIQRRICSAAVPIEAPTILFLFDIPLLRDIDSNPGNTGYLEAMSSAILTWPGAALLRSSDDANFPEQIDQSTIAVAFGYATTVLGKPRSPWTWDRLNSLTVKMTVGTLTSDTELNVLNGSNALLVGNFVDGFEVIQYVRSTLNADGTSRFHSSRAAGADPIM
jgi:hypothetical protein